MEEAYNQNFGVVQHISSFTRFWDSKDWIYTFTQEWPVPGDERHQLSYTLVGFALREPFPAPGRASEMFSELSLPVGGKRRHPGRLLASSQPDLSHGRFDARVAAREVLVCRPTFR